MERAFHATKESQYYKDFVRYVDRVETQKSFVKAFLKEHNIETVRYYVSGNGCCNVAFSEWDKDDIRLSIIPTEKDLETVGKQLTKADSYGLCKFRANSKVSKTFAQYCIDNEIIINTTSLDLRDYLKSMGWMGYSIQSVPSDDGLYLKITSELLKKEDVPEGFIVIPISEFYKHLEEYSSEK